MLKSLFAFLLFFNCTSLFAQNYEKEFETQFVWEVKQINEFIERFNDSDTTLLKQYYQKRDTLEGMTRERLIKSLFNTQKTDWNFSEIQSFIRYADDKSNPKYLDFFNGDWYAKVGCSVTWKGRPEAVVLTMQIQKMPNNTYKWVVTNANAAFLRAAIAQHKGSFHMPSAIDSTRALNPMSHATDFMGIDQVSEDRINIADYFQDPDKCDAETQQFIQECLNRNLKILRANTVSYNFMQIKGWNIEIQQFNRADKNSGWLISKLTKTSSE